MTKAKKKTTLTFKFRSQTYKEVGTQPYTMQSGRCIDLVVLRTKCPVCNNTFEFLSSRARVTKRQLRRRCDEHKRPGVPVEYRLPSRTRRKPVIGSKSKQSTITSSEPSTAQSCGRSPGHADVAAVIASAGLEDWRAKVAKHQRDILLNEIFDNIRKGFAALDNREYLKKYEDALGMLA